MTYTELLSRWRSKVTVVQDSINFEKLFLIVGEFLANEWFSSEGGELDLFYNFVVGGDNIAALRFRRADTLKIITFQSSFKQLSNRHRHQQNGQYKVMSGSIGQIMLIFAQIDFSLRLCAMS